jgi:hypothetical protein
MKINCNASSLRQSSWVFKYVLPLFSCPSVLYRRDNQSSSKSVSCHVNGPDRPDVLAVPNWLCLNENYMYFYSFFSSFIPKYFHPAMNEIIRINLRLSQWVKGWDMCELGSCLATFTSLPGFYWWIYKLVHGAGTVAEEILQYYQHYQPVFSPWQGPRGVE